MPRYTNISKEHWNLLSPDEREVFELFDKRLPPEWEMYIKPHLNGLYPDVVLLNPYAGIALFDIIKLNEIVGNPLEKIEFYKEEILKLYCPGLKARFGKKGAGAITAGLIFTRVDQVSLDTHSFFSDRSYPKYYPIAGSDSLAAGDLNKLFPEWKQWGLHNPSRLMSPDTGDDLRRWLKEPDFKQAHPNPLKLTGRQREIAETRTEIYYRRVKGAAGAGKTQALAARAAVLSSEGKRVLVCLFNITLRYYPRDLAWQHATSLPMNSGLEIDFLHFHDWCKRICYMSGNGDRYKPLAKILASKNSSKKELVWNELMPNLVQEIYKEKGPWQSTGKVISFTGLEQMHGDSEINDVPPYYDAILVDEGQDFTIRWWETLEKALLPEGEMLFVADTTQNIYGRDFTWLKEEMSTGGFRGRWFELGPSYRLPSRLITILQRFADEFLDEDDEDIDIPRPVQDDLFLDLQLRWVQISSSISIDDCFERIGEICFEEVQRLRKNPEISDSDITFLAHTNAIGRVFVKKCKSANVSVHHIFGNNEEDSRNKKLDFRPEDSRMKATTLHSFKGLESRHLIVNIGSITRDDDPALFYTALTRLKKYDQGRCCLTVVSSCPELESFGKEWEDFEKILV